MFEADFNGKVAIVTGGSSGMGLLTSRCLHKQGAFVTLVDFNEQALDDLKAEFNDCLLLKADVRNFSNVKEVVDKTVEKYGKIDILVNCAGGTSSRILNSPGEFVDRPIEHIDWGIDVNLKGVVYFCHEVMKQMRSQKSGVVVNMGSITGIEGDYVGIDYAISKSAIMSGLNTSLAKFGANYGIRVNCVAPGPVLTRAAMANMKTAIGRAAEPQEIVDMILYLVSDKSSFVTGSTFLMDGGRHFMDIK